MRVFSVNVENYLFLIKCGNSMCSAEPSTKMAPSAKNKSQWVVCKYLVTKRFVASSLPKTSERFTTLDVATLPSKSLGKRLKYRKFANSSSRAIWLECVLITSCVENASLFPSFSWLRNTL